MRKTKENLIDTPVPAPAPASTLAKAPSTAIRTNDPDNPWLAYGESVGTNTIVGDLLKFNKGDYVAGREEREIPLGTRLVVNMESLEVGWRKWVDGAPAGRRMGLVAEGFKPAERAELGDNDPALWEVDDNGKPRDPWQRTNEIVMAEAANGDLYTFATSTVGGRDAVGKLSTQYGQAMRQRPDEWPVIALSASSYQHRDRSRGRIKVPIFDVVGWAPAEMPSF